MTKEGYELGYAHALRRPVILIAHRSEHMLFDIRSVRALFYDPELGRQTGFIRTLESAIREALQNPESFSMRPRTETTIDTVFVSYSHKDEEFLDRLRVHLKPLEKLVQLGVDPPTPSGSPKVFPIAGF